MDWMRAILKLVSSGVNLNSLAHASDQMGKTACYILIAEHVVQGIGWILEGTDIHHPVAWAVGNELKPLTVTWHVAVTMVVAR